MKKIPILVILAVGLLTGGLNERSTWVISTQSQLSIVGSTNVNEFTCKITDCTGTDTLQYIETSCGTQLRFTRTRMVVPVRGFDCGARPISRDFWKTVKADEHPELEINFISLNAPSFRQGKEISGIVDITLAGVKTRYNIGFHAEVLENGNVNLAGSHVVRFSDFQLHAPQKFQGLVKVKEALKVQFKLVLRKV